MTMSTENSPGKKDPANQPIVLPGLSRTGLNGAMATVANAPIPVYTYSSGGKRTGP